MTTIEFYEAVQKNGGCENDETNVWCSLDGVQANIKWAEPLADGGSEPNFEWAKILPDGETEPFEVSFILDKNPDHWAWDELFEDWKGRKEI